jgi:hypothetical protein
MAIIAHSQTVSVAFGNSSSARSLAFASNNTAGGLIIVGVNSYGVGTETVTVADTRGNTYVQAGSYTTSSFVRVSIWYAKNCAAGANTVTITPSATVYLSFSIGEYSGADTTAPYNSSTGASGNSSAISSGSVAVNDANSLLYGTGVLWGNTGSGTPGSGFTERADIVSGANDGVYTEDKIASAAAVCDYTASNSGTWTFMGASFKPPAAGGTNRIRALITSGIN